jgi:hypothetical protein
MRHNRNARVIEPRVVCRASHELPQLPEKHGREHLSVRSYSSVE